jgi:cytochrome oxidase Cu insertion factor (SCO1/SenC/PrrC family)
VRRALALLALLAAGPGLAGEARTPAEQEARARDYFTDTPLVDQHGATVRFYSDVLAGKVVVISFMFAQCQGACPLIAAKLNQVRARLGDDFGERIRFVSISVDPGNDTPEALRAFAERNRTVHPAWTYLTGSDADVKTVLRKLGEKAMQVEDHGTALLAGNLRTRHWKKLRSDVPAEAIALELTSLAGEVAAPVAAAPAGK